MKANIIYPTLVEQSYKYLNSMGIQANKDEIYREMVKNGLIDQLGEPTPQAIKEGFISVLNVEHKTLREFKNEFTVFKKYPAEEFYQAEGIWYISTDIADELLKKCESNSFSKDKMQQIATYFSFRNYDEPRTVGEFKGVNHPMYSSYPDEHFHLANGQICVDSTIMRDMANRVLTCDIAGNTDNARALLADLDNL